MNKNADTLHKYALSVKYRADPGHPGRAASRMAGDNGVMNDRRLAAARRLHALARTGLNFCPGEYDRQRYEEIERIAAELLVDDDASGGARLQELWSAEAGYVTPKIEVRGAVFRDGQVLLVHERADGLWTLPGGWADVGETPSQAVTREIEQESGFRTRAVALAALWDRNLHGGAPGLFHSWKAFFLCEITGGAARGSYETEAASFFDVERLPAMSLGRSTPAQVARLHAHWLQRPLPAEFD
jgi:ADP-ribose pyrophosphatase YjhB (NUDIX family)